MSPSIYNSTDGPLAIDRAGHMLGAREHMPAAELDVDASPLSGHIEAERIVVVDESPAQDDENMSGSEVGDDAAEAPTTTRSRSRARTQEA